jgi:hypothetical protein
VTRLGLDAPDRRRRRVAAVRTTWIIVHERDLEPHEDPLAVLEHRGPELVLWAVEEGTASVVVEIVEQQ